MSLHIVMSKNQFHIILSLAIFATCKPLPPTHPPPSLMYGPSIIYGYPNSVTNAGYRHDETKASASFDNGNTQTASNSSVEGFGHRNSEHGGVQVECKGEEISEKEYRFNCESSASENITVVTNYILKLEGKASALAGKTVDINVPNYKLKDILKVGFNHQPANATSSFINVHLERPEQAYEAQVDQVISYTENPFVKLHYEPLPPAVTKIHFPSDVPYSPRNEDELLQQEAPANITITTTTTTEIPETREIVRTERSVSFV